MGARIFRYVAGGNPRFVPFKPRIKISDDELEALRMLHPGSTGHPRGLRAMAEILGCSDQAIRYRLRKIAEREESE